MRTKVVSSVETLMLASLAWGCAHVWAVPDPGLRLPKTRNHFFAEDNLVYSRYLSLARDGTYRQFNQDHTATVEADRGTWEQDAASAVILHSTFRGLRFRALLSGPLTTVLDEVGKLDALPVLATAIQQHLEASQASVFTASEVAELTAPPATVAVDRQVESFSRADLAGLLVQIEETVQNEQTHTYRFALVRLPDRPLLLVLRGAVFGPDRAAQTCREYRVPPGAVPPFYFAQVNQKEFMRRVGVWRALEPPGGPSEP